MPKMIIYFIFFDNYSEGFFRVLPQERHFFAKVFTEIFKGDLTFPIEQTNSDIRHRLARFKRKTKASSPSIEMINNSIKLFHFFQENHPNDPPKYDRYHGKIFIVFQLTVSMNKISSLLLCLFGQRRSARPGPGSGQRPRG